MVIEPLEPRHLLASYFVSPTGSDSNPGTSLSPLRTLQRASNAAIAGDTVTARPGSYVGFYRASTQSGTASRPVTFKAEVGAAIISRNSLTNDGINLEKCSYVTIDGFSFDPSGAAWRSAIRAAGGPTGDIIKNCTVPMRSTDTYGIFSSFAVDLQVTGNDVSGTNNSAIYTSNSAVRPVVSYNRVHDVGNAFAALHFNGDASQGGSGIVTGATITGNTFRNVGTAINCDGLANSTISNNFIESATNKGINLYRQDASGGSSGNTVSGNVVAMAAGSFFALGARAASSGCHFSGNYTLCSNHTFLTDSSSLPGTTFSGNLYSTGDFATDSSSSGTHAGFSKALIGDCNLDGRVSADDYVIVGANLGLSSGATWVQGDANGDGAVTADDYATIGAAIRPAAPVALTITTGGTYSGTFTAVTVATDAPVTLSNSTIRGSGDLIHVTSAHAKLTVTNVSGYGTGFGRFLDADFGADSIAVTDCYLENTAGMLVDGNSRSGGSISIHDNRALNIVAPAGEITNFVQLQNFPSVNAEVAWNQVINEPGKSQVEDVISIYRSSGTAALPLRIHDNFIDGAYPPDPSSSDFSGSCIMIDYGSSFVRVENNQVINGTNCGIGLESGHDNIVTGNRVLMDEILPASNVGLIGWSLYGNSDWARNVVSNNTVDTAFSNDWWLPDTSNSGNVHGAMTLAGETAIWNEKLIANGEVIP